MKNIVSAILFLAIPVATNAQLQKGNIMVGGTGGLGIGGGNGGAVFTGHVQPRIGLFLTDRLVAGTSIGLGLTTYRNQYFERKASWNTSVQPFLRYYLLKAPANGAVPKNIMPFAELGAGVNSVFAGNYRATGGTAYGAIGINKFFNQHVALEATLNYSRRSASLYGSPFYGNGLGGSIGFQIFLNRAQQKTTATTER